MSTSRDGARARPPAGPLLVVFLLGVVLGSLIVAWALWRRRIVPVWSPVAIVLGTILNFLADGAALSSMALGLQLVGFGWVGLRMIGTGE